MKNFFIDMETQYILTKNICLQAANDKNSRIIVPNEEAKEFCEGIFSVNEIKPLCQIIIDKSKFLTGEDIYHAMWDERSEVSKEEWETLPEHTKTIYLNVAANLIKRINEKGGW